MADFIRGRHPTSFSQYIPRRMDKNHHFFLILPLHLQHSGSSFLIFVKCKLNSLLNIFLYIDSLTGTMLSLLHWSKYIVYMRFMLKFDGRYCFCLENCFTSFESVVENDRIWCLTLSLTSFGKAWVLFSDKPLPSGLGILVSDFPLWTLYTGFWEIARVPK